MAPAAAQPAPVAAPVQQPAAQPQQPSYTAPQQQAYAAHPPQQQAHAAPEPRATACLRMIDSNGQAGEPILFQGERVDLGRIEGEICFADDAFLDRRHARFELREGRWYVTDLETLNGTFLRLRERAKLSDGDRILLGRQLLLFETLKPEESAREPVMLRGVMVFGCPGEPLSARITRITTEGLGRDVVYLYRPETMLGRERGDVVFSDDAFLSRSHAKIVRDAGGQHFLEDLGSSNGTALRIRGRAALSHGDELRVGRHLFRFEDLRAGTGPA